MVPIALLNTHQTLKDSKGIDTVYLSLSLRPSSFAINLHLLYISCRLLYITAANYRGSCPLTRLITTNAPRDTQPRAAPRFQICSTGVYGVANRSIERREGKKKEKNRDATRKKKGRVRERETEEADSYHLARLRRRLTQRGYRGRLVGHIEGARST